VGYKWWRGISSGSVKNVEVKSYVT